MMVELHERYLVDGIDRAYWMHSKIKITGRWKITKENTNTILWIEKKGFLFKKWLPESLLEIYETDEYINECK